MPATCLRRSAVPAARRRLKTLVFGCALARCLAADDSVPQEVQYIWPTIVWQVSLFSPSEADNEQEAGLTKRLAAVAEEGFQRYVRESLPLQLERDPAFREQYEASDVTGRNNEAFLRWQKMSFALRNNVRLEEVNWIGPQPPNLRGMRYDWKELHDSPDFKRLSKNMENQAFKLLKHINPERQRERFRVFVWAEVYRRGDFDMMHVHTGAMAAGIFAAGNSGPEESRQTLVLQDVRGPNPPFGDRHQIALEEGELAAFPAWSPHYFLPHPGNESNVFFCFLMWPHGGAYDFDWEDDNLGDYVYRKTTTVRRTDSAREERRQEL